MANRFLNNIRINDSYTLPSADGSTNQVITTDGAGNLSFIDVNSVIDTATGEVYYTVKNSTGSTLSKGKAVMAVGSDGNSGHILVDEMIADGSIESKYFLGVLAENIGNGNTGKAIHFGLISQFNTNGQNGETWDDGQILWCDPANPGDFTITEPDGPNVKVAAAFILNSSTNGKIQVRVQANEGIHDLHDTKITSQVDGDVLVWDNTTGVWFNDSTLNVDYTNGNVGIGTTSPGSKLTVNGSTESISLNTDHFRARYNSTYYTDYSTNGVRFNGTNQTYSFIQNGTNRMSISASGNVGIGTTSAVNKLQIDASSVADIAGVSVSSSNSSTSTQIGYTANNVDGSTLFMGVNGYGYTGGLGSNYAGAVISTIEGAQPLVLGTDSTERIRITETGDVGIGTNSPGQKLDVNGVIAATGGNSTQWNTAYTDRNKWDGGATGLVAATGRTSLELGALATLNSVNAATITDNSVGAAELNVSGNGTTAQYLRSDGDGTFTWATPTNTTYTAGTGLKLELETFRLNGGEIPGSVDLNTYRTTGIFCQNSNADAVSGSNYPVAQAGILEVYNDDYGNGLFTVQRYSRYNSINVYQRQYYNGTWTAWRDLTQDTNTTYTAGGGLTLAGTEFSHTDTSSQASVDNANGVVIQDVTLDTYGHVTGLASVNLDGRYYTESEADGRFVNVTGDTMTGSLRLQADLNYFGLATINNEAEIVVNTGEGGSPQIGFTDHGDASWAIGVDDGDNSFKIHGTANAVIPTINNLATPIFELTTSGLGYFGTQRIFADNYHPNADTWTTSRTLSLTGDVSGSVSWNGSADASLSVTVNNDSHEHSYIKAGGDGPSTEDLNSVANSVTVGRLSYRGYNLSSTNRPPANDNANGVITVGQHNGGYNAQVAFSSDGNMYWRDNPGSTNGSWRTMWDSGNDGSGSGLDADLLDGQHASAFAPVSHTHTWASIPNNSVNGWGGLRHQTNSGYIDFGPANGSYAHIYTDRPNFYYNKDILVNGVVVLKGSGTTNYLSKFTGSTTLGNSLVYDNGTNVGIGTTNPGAKLEVYGSSPNILINNTDETDSGIVFGDSQAGTDQRAAIKFNSSDEKLKFFVNDETAQRMVIDTSGNVGIGTNTPGYTLDVNGSLHSTSLNIADAIYHEGDTNTYIQFVANDTIRWVTSGSERMRLNSAGGLGIGTSTITTGRSLDVNGNALVRSNLYIGPTGGSASAYSLEIGQGRSGNGFAIIDLSGDATYGGDFSLRIIRGNTGANATSQIIHRGTGAFSIETLENANILLNPGSGRVGIGSSNPGNKLYVTDSRAGANAPADLAAIHGYNSSTDTSTANSVGVAGTSLTTSGKAIYGNAPNGGWGGYFNGKGFFDNTVTATNFILSSDKTLKDNISDINTDHVDVKWKNFELKSEPGVKRAGVVAQELEEKHPEFVRTDKDGIKSVAYIDLLIAKIAELEARLEKLEK